MQLDVGKLELKDSSIGHKVYEYDEIQIAVIRCDRQCYSAVIMVKCCMKDRVDIVGDDPDTILEALRLVLER